MFRMVSFRLCEAYALYLRIKFLYAKRKTKFNYITKLMHNEFSSAISQAH